MSIDVESIVFTEDAPKVEAVASTTAPQAPKVISQPLDVDSISFDGEPSGPATPHRGIFAQLREAITPELFTDFATAPMSIATKAGVNAGMKEGMGTEPIVHEDPNKEKDSAAIASVTGFSKEEVAEHYDSIKFLATFGQSLGQRVDPVTTKEIVDKTMTPALVIAAAANPIGTVAGLVAFTALDHLVPTEKFIPEDATKSQEASIELVGMLAKGALVGGLFHGVEAAAGRAGRFTGTEWDAKVDILSKHAYAKLKEQGLPDVVVVTPEQIKTIQEKETIAEVAQQGISEPNLIQEAKLAKRKAQTVNLIARSILKQEGVPPGNFTPEIIIEGKRAALEAINMKEYNDRFMGNPGKLLNREKRLRFELTKELKAIDEAAAKATPTVAPRVETPVEAPGMAQEARPVAEGTVLETLGIDQKTLDSAVANNLSIKVPAEKLVRVAVESPEKFEAVKHAIGEVKPIQGTGETKTAGLSKGVEAKAVEKKLTDGFGDLPEYQVVNMKDQAAKASELVAKDFELAKRIAMGQEPTPAGMVPEAVFIAVENKALLEGDSATLRGLATGSKLATEATTMGQRIRTLAERDPESATGAIKDVMKTREEMAQKRLGKKETIQKATEKVVEGIKKEIEKVKTTKQSWEDFVLSIQC